MGKEDGLPHKAWSGNCEKTVPLSPQSPLDRGGIFISQPSGAGKGNRRLFPEKRNKEETRKERRIRGMRVPGEKGTFYEFCKIQNGEANGNKPTAI